MNAEIARRLKEIGANRQDSVVLTGGLSDAQLNWKPTPQVWSMAQNITHLSMATSIDFPDIVRAVEYGKENQMYSAGPFNYGFINRWFIGQMEPPPKRRFQAPKAYLPPSDVVASGVALAGYHGVLDQLAALVEEADGLDLARVKTVMAVFRFLKMPLGARFLIMTAHTRRHLWQALQVRKHPQFPTK